MANILKKEKQATVISALVEGNSIRSIERMTDIHRDTIMRLGIRIGKACEKHMDETMQNLNCERIEIDEIWGYVGKKEKNCSSQDSPDIGDAWTFVAIDPDSKLVPCFKTGKRDFSTTLDFINSLSSRMKNRIQLSSDAMPSYIAAIEETFGANVDYAQIVKAYTTTQEGTRKYSPPKIVAVNRSKLIGNPYYDYISTSHVERQNLTMRMHCRRLSRLTNAFSKKLENFKAAISLHFMYYNFVKTHKTIQCTPAMEAGIENSHWEIMDMVELAN